MSPPIRQSDLATRRPQFHQASTQDILNGNTADVYFERTLDVLRRSGLNPNVRAEFAVKGMPHEYQWAVFAGLEEVFALLDKRDVSMRGFPEGSVIRSHTPIFEISGRYQEFARLETAILGMVCQSSGVATKAARIRHFAGDRTLISFGARRMHPAVAPVIERAAFIGGCDGVSVLKSAELLGTDPTGTMPHSLILIVGDTLEATRLYDQTIDDTVSRIALIDTYSDEKFEAIRVAEALGSRLHGIRLDTPGSRRGNFEEIVREIRWELDLREHTHVQIFVSGGLDEEEVRQLCPIVDGFGVGTSIANARTIDFSMDIVEIDGEPVSKRGKMSGAKQVWRKSDRLIDVVAPLHQPAPGGEGASQLEDLIVDGNLVVDVPDPSDIRERVVEQLRIVGRELDDNGPET